jgi:hypothetical protein
MGARSRIARWKASQNDFQALKGAFRNLVLVRAAQLSRVIARHTGERRVDVYERLITRWTEPLARQTVTLRNLLMVILPASSGELVKLELGEIDFDDCVGRAGTDAQPQLCPRVVH